MSFVAHSCTLRAAAEGLQQATRSTLKYVLNTKSGSRKMSVGQFQWKTAQIKNARLCGAKRRGATWLMCSAPVQVKLQVSLQQRTYSGESSGLVPDGQIISMNTESAPSLSPMAGSPTVTCGGESQTRQKHQTDDGEKPTSFTSVVPNLQAEKKKFLFWMMEDLCKEK